MTRQCSDCTLCCRLLPMKAGAFDPIRHREAFALFGHPAMMRDFDKAAGERCQHQRHTGCAVYAKRPMGCRAWSCRWLAEDDTADLRRPDRAGYVIDVMPDYIRCTPKDGSSEGQAIPVVQIWVDPKRRDDWRQDDALWRYLERRAADGMAAILRYSATEALILMPPQMTEDHQWHEVSDSVLHPERSLWPDDAEVKIVVSP